MSENPKVTVLMNCRNSDEFLREAIDTVFLQDFDDWEIVFYDNNSSDSSADIAKSYGSKVRYIFSEKALTLSIARNEAIKEAHGKYIAILDCDDLWSPNKLSKQVAAMEEHEGPREAALCYTDAMRVNSQGENIAPYSQERTLHQGDAYKDLIKDCFVSMSSAMFRKDTFDEVGGFEPHYNQVEDLDLWLKLAKNHDVVLVDEHLTKIRIHSNNLTRSFGDHSDEKIALISRITPRDKKEEQIIERVLRELELRKQISKLIESRNSGAMTVLTELFRSAVCSVARPYPSFLLMEKYMNLKMLKIFWAKYIRA